MTKLNFVSDSDCRRSPSRNRWTRYIAEQADISRPGQARFRPCPVLISASLFVGPLKLKSGIGKCGPIINESGRLKAFFTSLLYSPKNGSI